MSSTRGLREAAPRLIAEFVVIVVGVLVALAADGWVQTREDRRVEEDYLQRLLEDVRADRVENRFVEAVHRQGLVWADSLEAWRDSGSLPGRGDAELMTAFVLASIHRQPDYAMGTYRELIASGRIGLIRSDGVRRALAEYDRQLNEYAGVWSGARGELHSLRGVVMETSELARHAVRCRADLGLDGCRFEWTGGSTERLRRALEEPGVGDAIRASMTYQAVTAELLATLIDPAANRLESALCAELPDGCATEASDA